MDAEQRRMWDLFQESNQSFTENSRPTKTISKAVTLPAPVGCTYTPSNTTNLREQIAEAKFRRRLEKAKIERIRKELYEEERLAKKAAMKKEKHDKAIANAITRSLKKKTKDMENAYRLSREVNFERLTPPKNRNWISRLIIRSHYDRGDYDEIREDIEDGFITKEDFESGELSKGDWRRVRKYEDARQDIKAKKALVVFKVALASLALISSFIICKGAINRIEKTFDTANTQISAEANKATMEMELRSAEARAMRFEDQQWLYEYTNGVPSLENWESLSDDFKQFIRNPVKAAEIALEHGNDQSFMYVMTDGDVSNETWQKLPDEVKQFIRQPSTTAREAREEGNDQRYLYEISRGQPTEEFWLSLPPEVQQHIRNPIELAKQFKEQGDPLRIYKNNF